MELGAEFLFQFGCSQEMHSHSTQRSESIQAGTKRHVKFRRLFDSESLDKRTKFDESFMPVR